MTHEIKVMIGIGIATLVVLIGGVFFLNSKETKKPEEDTDNQAILIKPYNHELRSESAKVTIVEFADFQCPACAAAHPIVKAILQKQTGNITFVYRHFPLPQHKNAILAAKTAEAAGEQDKFWDMYDLLYQRQDEWSESKNADEIMKRFAKELQLDLNKFSQVMSSDKFTDHIQQDKNDGIELGVNSTPTFFVNGRKLFLRSPTDLPTMIDEEVAKTK